MTFLSLHNEHTQNAPFRYVKNIEKLSMRTIEYELDDNLTHYVSKRHNHVHLMSTQKLSSMESK